MKITGFVGSPRKKGNTDTLVDTFLNGAGSTGVEVQKFFLNELDINPCLGCFRNCMVKPGHVCRQYDDDMAMLLEEMIVSDVMLFASPLYCGTYSSLMARFFERCLPLTEVEVIGKEGTREGYRKVNNPVKGKKAVIGLVQDLIYPQVGDLALKVFEKNVAGTYEMDIVERLHVTDVRDKNDLQKKEAVLKKIYETGKSTAGKR